jgi:hypothetical protein
VCDYVRPGTMGPNVVAPYGGVGIPQGALVPPAPVVVPAVIVPGPGAAPVPGVVPPPAPLPGNRFPQLQPPTSEIPLPPTPPNFPR